MLAFRAHLQIVFQRLSPDNLPAMFALEPQPFSADTPAALFGINRRFVASEPGHCKYQFGTGSLSVVGQFERPWPFIDRSRTSRSGTPSLIRALDGLLNLGLRWAPTHYLSR